MQKALERWHPILETHQSVTAVSYSLSVGKLMGHTESKGVNWRMRDKSKEENVQGAESNHWGDVSWTYRQRNYAWANQARIN